MNLIDGIKDYIAPIVAALAGSGFSFHFDKSGSSVRRSDVSIENHASISGNGNTVSNVNIIDKSRKIVNYHGRNGGGGNEGFAIIIVGSAAIVGSIYGYSIYAPLVFYYVTLTLQCVAVFSVCFGFTGGLRGTKGWEMHAFYTAPALLLLGVAYMYCLPKLYSGYSPTYAEYAQHYGAIGYFKIINGDVRNWILSQIAGLSCLVGAIAFTVLYSVANNNRQRTMAIVVAAVLLFGCVFGAEGNIHAGI